MSGTTIDARDMSSRPTPPGSASGRGRWALPLVPVALSGFLLSAVTAFRVRGADPLDAAGFPEALVATLYGWFGFEPLFLVAALTLAWSSIWFLTGDLDRPLARAGRIAAFGLCVAILVNLRVDGTVPVGGGAVGAFFAGRLANVLWAPLAILMVAAASLAALLLATDFFFYRWFETLTDRGRWRAPRDHAARATGVDDELDVGVEPEAIAAFEELRHAVALEPGVSSEARDGYEAELTARAVAALDADDAGVDAIDLPEAEFPSAAPRHGWPRSRGDREPSAAPVRGRDVTTAIDAALADARDDDVVEIDAVAAPSVSGVADDAGADRAAEADAADDVDDRSWSARRRERRGGWRSRRSWAPDPDADGDADGARDAAEGDAWGAIAAPGAVAAPESARTRGEDRSGDDRRGEATAATSTSSDDAGADTDGDAVASTRRDDAAGALVDGADAADDDDAFGSSVPVGDAAGVGDGDGGEALAAADVDTGPDVATEAEIASEPEVATDTAAAADDAHGAQDHRAPGETGIDVWELGFGDEAAGDEPLAADHDVAEAAASAPAESRAADARPSEGPPDGAAAAPAGPVAAAPAAGDRDTPAQGLLFATGTPDPHLLAEARALVVEYRRATRNFLRRRLRITGAEAEGLLLELSRQGVVVYRAGEAQAQILAEGS